MIWKLRAANKWIKRYRIGPLTCVLADPKQHSGQYRRHFWHWLHYWNNPYYSPSFGLVVSFLFKCSSLVCNAVLDVLVVRQKSAACRLTRAEQFELESGGLRLEVGWLLWHNTADTAAQMRLSDSNVIQQCSRVKRQNCRCQWNKNMAVFLFIFTLHSVNYPKVTSDNCMFAKVWCALFVQNWKCVHAALKCYCWYFVRQLWGN